jgi:hypothetical protein
MNDPGIQHTADGPGIQQAADGPGLQRTAVLVPENLGQCPSCRALLAPDQNYCLSCGARQAGARMPPVQRQVGEPPTPAAHGAAGDGAGRVRDWTPVLALGGLAGLALVLVIGVLIGRSGQNGAAKVAAAPQVITVQGGGSPTVASPTATPAAKAKAGASATSVASISGDWPAGTSSWTVELQTLTKGLATAASVNAAKSADAAKGARGVGVLDAAKYTALGSAYVIYSGVYSSQAKATAALAKLRGSFPSAKVIHVVPRGSGGSAPAASVPAPVSASQQSSGAAAIKSLSSCRGSACSKASGKITAPIATPGKPPPVDHKAAGGGGGGQSFQ